MKKSFLDYIKRYKLRSVFIRYIFLLAIFLLVPVQVFVSVYQNCYYALMKQEIATTSEVHLKKMEYMFDTLMQNIDRQALLIANKNEIRKFAMSEDVYGYDNYDYKQIEQSLEQFNLGLDEIASIYVYSEKSGYVFSTVSGGTADTFYDNSWVADYNSRKNEGRWISLRKIYDMAHLQDVEYLTLFRTIEVYNQTIGVLVVNIDTEVLKERYLNVSNTEVGVSIYDLDNRCLLAVGNTLVEPQSLREQFNKTGEHVITYDTSDDDKLTMLALRSNYTEWLLVYNIDLDYLESNHQILNFIKYFTISIYLIVSLIIIYIFIRWIMIPVSRILDSVNLSYDETTGMFAGDDSEDEMMLIRRTLQDSTQMKDELQLKINNLKAAQFAMLQSQISPHFLINTLSSAYWYMVRQSGGKTPVTELLSSLTALIQNTFSTKDNFWNISDEIEHLEKFIKVQKFRFGEDITINIDVDPEIFDCKVIRLTLQPIVENAFQHGLMHRVGDLIDVRGKRDNGDILFEIYDNGCGISEEAIEEIVTTSLDEGKYMPLHGLKNVDYRIKLLFGNMYGVTITRPESGGTLICIRIPEI